MGKRKIALAVDHFLPEVGGIEVQVSELARRLSREGHQVHVLTACPRSADFDGVKVHRIPGRLLARTEVFYSGDFLRAVSSLLQEECFDVVHCHSSIFSPLAYGTSYLCRKKNIPSVLTNHSLFSAGSTLAFRLSAPFLRYSRWPLVLSAVSSPAAQRFGRAFPGKKVRVLPNAVDPHFWRTERKPSPRLRVVTVGRLHRKKNPQAFIRSIPRVNALLPPALLPIFTVIGDGPERGELQSLARSLGVSEQVEFLGRLKPEEIRGVFSSSDIYALASSWESQSISILEACGAGLPIVGMNRGGVPDIVTHGQEGLLANDAEQFALSIARLAKEPETRQNMGRRAQERAQHFSWEKILPENLRLYEMAMAGAEEKLA